MLNSLSNILSEIKSGFKNLFTWLPIIWRDRNWDYMFLLRIMLFKLQLMEKYLENEQESRKLHVCSLLLQRLVEDEYETKLFDLHEKKWGKAKFDIYPTLTVTYEKVTTEKDKKQELKDLQKLVNHANYLQHQDLEYFCKLFRKHVFTWWN